MTTMMMLMEAVMMAPDQATMLKPRLLTWAPMMVLSLVIFSMKKMITGSRTPEGQWRAKPATPMSLGVRLFRHLGLASSPLHEEETRMREGLLSQRVP